MNILMQVVLHVSPCYSNSCLALVRAPSERVKVLTYLGRLLPDRFHPSDAMYSSIPVVFDALHSRLDYRLISLLGHDLP
jgi:hypothetical protein